MNKKREILYRAWLKKENKMVEVKSIHFGTNKIMYGYSDNAHSYGNKTCSFEDCELMQFIGLYDKNGNRIFEGDIVRFNNQVFEVVFENNSFGLGCSQGINYKKIERDIGDGYNYLGCYNDNFISLWEINWNFNDIDDQSNQIEVIGNIYDNPELLGGNNA